MKRRMRQTTGQSLIEYAVLVSAVILGIGAAARFAYQAFVDQAQEIEEHEVVF